ncbi:MAG: hypothetical protein Tsb005_19560 [Gammaproteobacteria bacterium]
MLWFTPDIFSIHVNDAIDFFKPLGRAINDARRGKNKRATEVYTQLHEDCERGFNKA